MTIQCGSDQLSLAELALNQPIVSTGLMQSIEEQVRAKLGADLHALGITILLAVGFITLEHGVTALLDRAFGSDVGPALSCILTGLLIVLYIRIKRLTVLRVWR